LSANQLANPISQGLMSPNEVAFANAGQRVGAFVIDLLVVAVLFIFALVVLESALPSSLKPLAYIFPWLYFPMAEFSKSKATLGKRMVGVMLTNMDGQKLSQWRYGLRFVVMIVSILALKPTYGLSAIAFLTIFFTKRRQTFYDLVSKALVVKKT
jgi:uncharacterized RDD family membrane protein YckC